MIPFQLCQLRSWAGKTVGQYHDFKGADGGKTVKSSLSILETCRIMFMSAAVKITYLYQYRGHMTVSFHSVLLPVLENPLSAKSQDSMLQPEPCSADRGWKVVRRGADISAQ